MKVTTTLTSDFLGSGAPDETTEQNGYLTSGAAKTLRPCPAFRVRRPILRQLYEVARRLTVTGYLTN